MSDERRPINVYQQVQRNDDDLPGTTHFTRTLVEDAQRPITLAEFEAGMGLLLDRIGDLCDAKGTKMQEATKAGVAGGIRAILDDKEQTKKFWKSGFDELSEHTSNGASQWVGRRFLTWLLVGVVSFAAAYLIRAPK